MKFTRIDRELDAVRWVTSNLLEVARFAGRGVITEVWGEGFLSIPSSKSGKNVACPNDWIGRREDGAIVVYSDDKLKEKYRV